jgi:hypothetical protein
MDAPCQYCVPPLYETAEAYPSNKTQLTVLMRSLTHRFRKLILLIFNDQTLYWGALLFGDLVLSSDFFTFLQVPLSLQYSSSDLQTCVYLYQAHMPSGRTLPTVPGKP